MRPAPSFMLPKSPIGGPGGPGASPMVSPGNNAGAKAAAIAKIRAVHETLKGLLTDFPTNSKEERILLDAIRKLSSLVARQDRPIWFRQPGAR